MSCMTLGGLGFNCLNIQWKWNQDGDGVVLVLCSPLHVGSPTTSHFLIYHLCIYVNVDLQCQNV